MASVLVVEDNETMREGVEITLSRMGLDVSCAAEPDYALELARKREFDLLVTDYKLPGMNGLELFRSIRQHRPGIDAVLITAFGSVELAVEAMREGAADFLTKPFAADELKVKVEKVLVARAAREEHVRLAEENRLLRSEVLDAGGFGELIGESEAIAGVFDTISRVAPTDASVLITGESGTGKELVARELHRRSPRAEKAFVKVSCAALAVGVLESELFGHEKGAFTGSTGRRRGRFELADCGTLFLDEIGEISPAVQVKLLRVLQEKKFERVGGEDTLEVDVRVVSATSRDLKAEVEKGNFREDLFYRLHVVPVHMPPLRERAGDIPLLAAHLAGQICRRMNRPPLKLEKEAMEKLQNYRWPGNVRELENVLERSIVLGRGESIGAADIPPLGDTPDSSAESSSAANTVKLPPGGVDLVGVLEGTERRLIEQALERAAGNKSEAARLLKIKNSVLYYKLEKYGFDL
ncbi:MAG: sigma-54-dependent Fis family transcriptional regulator [Candidatus Glassbacteria bacterium]|nr:sigma-54-dependent Fis family transcriptional regulator [Candidatus Glassbacteria bacterium]